MKTTIKLACLLLLISVTASAQSINADDSIMAVLSKALENLKEGTLTMFAIVNWVYMPLGIIVAWLFNDYAESDNKATWLNWARKMDKVKRFALSNIFTAILYCFVYETYSKVDMFSMFITIIVILVALRSRIYKLFRMLSLNVFGLNFTDVPVTKKDDSLLVGYNKPFNQPNVDNTTTPPKGN